MRSALLSFTCILFVTVSAPRAEAEVTPQTLQSRWAEISYRIPARERDEAFSALTEIANTAVEAHPENAALWVWLGIIKASHAGARGGLGALSLVKSAKKDLERSIDIDDKTLHGAAYTTLGSLYYQVPGWPIGFGSDKKAEDYLRRGLEIAPGDIDANYFYADFLFQSGEYTSALQYADRANNAEPRAGRELEDEGRRTEIRTLINKIEAEIR